MSGNWVRVNDPNDFQPMFQKEKRFYVLISKHGLIRCAYPYRVSRDSNGDIKEVTFDSCSGSNGMIFTSCTDIIAYKEIEIPDDIVEAVTDHKKGLNSYLGQMYTDASFDPGAPVTLYVSLP